MLIFSFFYLHEASPNGMVFKPCISKYKNGLYKMMGEMIALCIVQGGESPSIFSSPLVDYILSGDITQVGSEVGDVSHPTVRSDLKKVRVLD